MEFGERTGGKDCKSSGDLVGRIQFDRRFKTIKENGPEKSRTRYENLVRNSSAIQIGSSELELQSELDQPRLRVADGTGDNSEVRIVCRATCAIRRPELGMVKQVEKLRAEFDICPFCNRRL